MRLFIGFAITLCASLPVAVPAQDSALTSLLTTHRHPLSWSGGRLAGSGGERLVAGAAAARFVLIGEEHGVAEMPRLVQALLSELRPRGFDTFAIEVSPPQGARLDAMRGRPNVQQRVDTLLSSWTTAVPFYGLAEERELLVAALSPLAGARPMRIWGMDYEVNAEAPVLEALARLAPPAGRAAVARAQALSTAGFEALKAGNPTQLFTWSAPDSVFTALRTAFGPRLPARAASMIDLLEQSARINRLFLAGRTYESNLMRSAFLRRNFVSAWERALNAGAAPRVVFKFGGSHMMRGLNYTHTLDIGTAATVIAEARGERAFSFLVLGGSGRTTSRLNPVKGAYEPTGRAEVDAANLAWLKPALPATGIAYFDMQAVRLAYLRSGRPLRGDQDRFLHAYDAIVVIQESTPGTARPFTLP